MENSVFVKFKTDFTLSLDTVKQTFNLKAGEINEQLGVKPLSHAEDTDQLYVAEVTQGAAQRMQESGNSLYMGTVAKSTVAPK